MAALYYPSWRPTFTANFHLTFPEPKAAGSTSGSRQMRLLHISLSFSPCHLLLWSEGDWLLSHDKPLRVNVVISKFDSYRFIIIMFSWCLCNKRASWSSSSLLCQILDGGFDINSKAVVSLVSSPPLLQLYELDRDPKRKEFLDDLFSFMQKRGMLLCSVSYRTIL